MVNTDAGYSSCFFGLIVTDLHSSIMVLIYSVDTIPLQIPVSLLADVVRFRPHRLRVSVPEPCPVSNSDHHRLDRVLEVFTVFALYAAFAANAAFGRLMSFNIFCGS